MTTAEKLVSLRGGKSREEVAKSVGVSLSAIAMYESGARIPRDEIKVKLADYFGTSVQSLFFDEDGRGSCPVRKEQAIERTCFS